MAVRLAGIAASKGVTGLAIGRAYVLENHAINVPHYTIGTDTSSIEYACVSLDDAVLQARQALEQLRNSAEALQNTEASAFLEVHELMLHDPVLIGDAKQWIREKHYNPAWALSTQIKAFAAQFEAMQDEYLRERAVDVRQVGDRVLRILLRQQFQAAQGCNDQVFNVAEDTIIIARDISPADMLQFEVALAGTPCLGLVTELGGVTSHTAIVARAKGLPAIVACAGAMHAVRSHDWVVIDTRGGMENASNAVLLTHLSEAELASYRAEHAAALLAHTAKQSSIAAEHTIACTTAEGEAVGLWVNLEEQLALPAKLSDQILGVGLYRSEFLFMGRDTLPSEAEQYSAYAKLVQAFYGKVVTLRTIDIGADKQISTQLSPNISPLGLRAIRYSLANPAAFQTQLRAILRATALCQTASDMHLLLPLISHVDEVKAAKVHIQQAAAALEAEGIAYAMPKIGAMIEVPAAALSIDSLLPELDFCSIGTNDLIQYTLAIDRTDAEVAAFYKTDHPAVLFLIEHVITRCKMAGVEVSVCGEMAGDATLTQKLLALGLRNFSMQPTVIADVKHKILRYSSIKP